MINTAMILAAGKGTRMRAGAGDPPKPLTQIADQSLLARMVKRLADTKLSRIVVNVHHKAEAIEAALLDLASAYPSIEFLISDERDILLETGGGVKKALPLLGNTPFLVANADVLWQETKPVLPDFVAAFSNSHCQALLLMARCDKATGYDGRGDYHMAENGKLRRADAQGAAHLFAGVQILTPALFDGAADGAFSLNEIYDKAEAEGALFGHELDGQWMHVGTPEGRAEAQNLMQA